MSLFPRFPDLTIGIVSPSAPVAAACPRRFKRGITFLEQLGFRVVVAEYATQKTRFTAGSVRARCADIEQLFRDTRVDIVMSTIGGYNANDLLDRLDYSVIAQHPKPFVGYSDITILLLALRQRCGIPVLLGPALLPQFGEFPDPMQFTVEAFHRVLRDLGTGLSYDLPCSPEWTEEFLAWDVHDSRRRVLHANSGWQVLRHGGAEGVLLGGNVRSFMALVGTPYQPDFRDSILVLEDIGDETPASLQRMLRQADHAGLLRGVRGVLFGRFQQASGMTRSHLQAVVRNIFGRRELPVIAGIDVGHTDPMLTLPLGVRVVVATKPPTIRLTL